MSIQVMEKSQECHPGFVIESDTLITTVDITAVGHLGRINGERVGPLHGYRKNGEGLNSLQCEEVADPLALVDLSGLAPKVAASLAVVI
jgi:hypothetical protein